MIILITVIYFVFYFIFANLLTYPNLELDNTNICDEPLISESIQKSIKGHHPLQI